jgi:hypothetical protein
VRRQQCTVFKRSGVGASAAAACLAIRSPELGRRVGINLNEATLAANVTRRITAGLNRLNQTAQLLAANLEVNGIPASRVKLDTCHDVSGGTLRTFLGHFHNGC